VWSGNAPLQIYTKSSSKFIVFLRQNSLLTWYKGDDSTAALIQQSIDVLFPQIAHQHRAYRRNQSHEHYNNALAKG
jgi:hypothetical protein